MSKNPTQNLVNQVKKFCKLEAELADEKGKINYNKLAPEQALKLKKIKNKMEASQLEIEEQLLMKDTPKKDNIKSEEIIQIRAELFDKEYAGDQRKWQRAAIDNFIAKLGIKAVEDNPIIEDISNT